MSRKFMAGVAAAALLSVSSPASAEDVVSTIFLSPGGNTSFTGTVGGGSYALIGWTLADGSVMVGQGADSGGAERSFVWRNGTLTDLGTLGGDDAIVVGNDVPLLRGVSSDATVIVGRSHLAGNTAQHAFRWVDGEGMEDLGTLGGTNSQATDVSADGSKVAGKSDLAGDTEVHAFRWVDGDGMEDLGTLGGTNSSVQAMSDDGNTIVGWSDTSGDAELHAYRWVDGDGMEDLGTLGGTESQAIDVSADGSVVVGYSNLAGDTVQHAFRWEEGGSMEDLGTLDGTGGSFATFISRDGTVILGASELTGADAPHAVRWKDGQIEDLNVLAANEGIDMDGILLIFGLRTANDDNNVIIAFGAKDGEGNTSFIFNITSGGLITEEELMQSLASSRVVGQQGSSTMAQGLGYSLFQARHALSTFSAAKLASNGATGMSAGSYMPPARVSAYAVGTFGIGQNGDTGNHAVNGTTGMMFRLNDTVAVGAGVIGGTSHLDTQLGGSSDMDSIGGSLIAAYEAGETGWRLYGTAAGAYMDSDTDRHYMNGSSVDASHGETHGLGLGTALRAGYAVPVMAKAILTPYGELEYAHIKMDGYAEQGGAFAATFGDHSMHRVASRLGASLDRDVTDTVRMGVHAAWGHRISGDGGTFLASSSGFTLPLSGNVGDRDWAEGGISGTFKLTPATTLSAELNLRSGKTEEARADATLGLNYAF